MSEFPKNPDFTSAETNAAWWAELRGQVAVVCSSQGKTIIQLAQARLQTALGLTASQLPVDGQIGPATMGALKDWATNNSLDAATLTAIQADEDAGLAAGTAGPGPAISKPTMTALINTFSIGSTLDHIYLAQAAIMPVWMGVMADNSPGGLRCDALPYLAVSAALSGDIAGATSALPGGKLPPVSTTPATAPGQQAGAAGGGVTPPNTMVPPGGTLQPSVVTANAPPATGWWSGLGLGLQIAIIGGAAVFLIVGSWLIYAASKKPRRSVSGRRARRDRVAVIEGPRRSYLVY